MRDLMKKGLTVGTGIFEPVDPAVYGGERAVAA